LVSLGVTSPALNWFIFLDSAVPIVRACVILAVCIVVFQAVRLVALPWLAAQYAIAWVAGMVSSIYFRRILPPHIADGQLPPLPLAALGLTAGFAADLSVLLAILLFLSEAAVLICRAYPDVRSRFLAFFVQLHGYVRPIGIVAILLALLEPVLPVAYYYSHPHA
jgi:hypothetical protein